MSLRLANAGPQATTLDILGGNCMFRVAAYAGPPGDGGRLLWPGVPPGGEICQQPLLRVPVPAAGSQVVTGYAPALPTVERAGGMRAVYPRLIVDGLAPLALLYVDIAPAALSAPN